MRHVSWRLVAVCAAVLLQSPVLQAAPVTFSFTGNVTQDPLAPDVNGNGVFCDASGASCASFAGSFAFDSATAGVPLSAGVMSYTGGSMTVQFANTSDPGVAGPYVADTLNITVDSVLHQYLVTGLSSTDPALSIAISLTDPVGTALNATALPTTPPSLASLQQSPFGFSLNAFTNLSDVQTNGVLTSLTCSAGCGGGVVAVPEPSGAAFAVGALIASIAVGRRRAREAVRRLHKRLGQNQAG